MPYNPYEIFLILMFLTLYFIVYLVSDSKLKRWLENNKFLSLLVNQEKQANN
jgi:uncharacterized membrane protein YbaN (DUF454 family)